MGVLTTKQRKHLSKQQFALPAQKKYPINDATHAINAKARAKQQYHHGNLSKSQLEKVDAAANKVLGKKK